MVEGCKKHIVTKKHRLIDLHRQYYQQLRQLIEIKLAICQTLHEIVEAEYSLEVDE